MIVSKRVQDNVAGAAMLGVFVLAASVSLSYGSRARLVPLAVAVAAVALMLVQLVVQNVARPAQAAEETSERSRSVRSGLAIAGVFVAGIVVLGILPATLLYVFGYLRWIGKARPLVAVVYAVGTWGVLYLMFSVFLGVPLYTGVFGLWVPYLSG